GARFDWNASMQTVREVQPRLEEILGHPLKLDDQVQDASFFAELFWLEDGAVRPNGVVVHCFKIAVRFSSFGRMVTIHTNSATSDLSQYPVKQLVAVLNQHGFQYIDPEALNELYDGRLQTKCAALTCWIRYFDYQ